MEYFELLESWQEQEIIINELEKDKERLQGEVLRLFTKDATQSSKLLELQNEIVNNQNRERELNRQCQKLSQQKIKTDTRLQNTRQIKHYLTNQLNLSQQELSNLNSLLSSKDNQIEELNQKLTQLEQIAQDYWQSSQTEIKRWQSVADTHAEALQTAEIWNKRKWDKLDTEKQNLIDLIRDKNNELDESEIELSLLDFQNSKEIEKLRAELTQLQQHYEDRLTQTKAEIIRLGGETNTLSQELSQEEELVDLKDRRLDNLTETIQIQTSKIDHLTKSKLRKQKTIIELSQQLSQDQGENRRLTELLTASEKKVQRLEKQLKAKDKKSGRTKTYQTNRINNLEKKLANLESENKTLKGKLTYYTNQDNQLRQTIQTLQNQINNHTCPPCPLIHLPTPHVCPAVNQTNCSHANYSEIKEQRDQYQQQAQTAQQEKEQVQQQCNNYQTQLNQQEQKIVQQLNSTFKLGLAENEKDLNRVIGKLKEIIDKPPLTVEDETIQQELEQAQQTITKLEKELKEQISFGKDLAVIKRLELESLEELFKNTVDDSIKQQIKQATNYQQLFQIRNAEIKKHLGQSLNNSPVVQPEKVIIQAPAKERIILISLLVVSLVSASGLLMKLRNKSKK